MARLTSLDSFVFFWFFEGGSSGFSSSKCFSWRKQSVQNFRLWTGTEIGERYLYEKDSGYLNYSEMNLFKVLGCKITPNELNAAIFKTIL